MSKDAQGDSTAAGETVTDTASTPVEIPGSAAAAGGGAGGGGGGGVSGGGASFVSAAKLISLLTLVSRLFGLLREIVQVNYFGTGPVAVAFRVAFTVPNLFRKLFGEGALSAAFIPLYVEALRDESSEQAARFAAASVTLLTILLAGITLAGEAVILGIIWTWPGIRPDMLLTLKLAAVMLPYVLLICGTAFLSAILQVHRRFGAPAAAPILLNVVHIAVMFVGGWILQIRTVAGDEAELFRRPRKGAQLSHFGEDREAFQIRQHRKILEIMSFNSFYLLF